MRIWPVWISGTAFLAIACSPNESEFVKAEQAVRAQLNDPESAQFSRLVLIQNQYGQTVCGLVKAKNALGSFVGPQRFYVWNATSMTFIEPSDDNGSFEEDWNENHCRLAPQAAS